MTIATATIDRTSSIHIAGPPCWIMVKNPLKSTSSGLASESSRELRIRRRAGQDERRRGVAPARA